MASQTRECGRGVITTRSSVGIDRAFTASTIASPIASGMQIIVQMVNSRESNLQNAAE